MSRAETGVLEGPAERLRIILGQADQHRHHPAYVEIIQRARSTGMAGATALGGVAGYGASSRVHHQHTLRVFADTPVDIVIIDRPERIEQFAAGLDELIVGGLVGRQPVDILRRRPGPARREASTGQRRQTKIERREGHMRLEGPGKRLTVYCGEADRYRHHSLADAVVELAREEGIAGATVLRGIEGFGASSHLRTTRILSMSEDLPLVIEMVDREDRIRAILPRLEHMMGDGLATLEDLQVWLHRAGPGAPLDDEETAQQ